MATDDLLIERLLRVVDEGRRTASYKLALLLGLIDAVAMSPGQSAIPTRLVAQRVVSIYYPQTRAFIGAGGMEHELRQITTKASPVLREVLRLRLLGDTVGCRSADDVRRLHEGEYRQVVDAVEDTFVRYPIPLMQNVGGGSIPFLYSTDWPEGTSAKSLRAVGADVIRLFDGVADRLAVLGPMLRPLIEMHWTRDVAKWSGIAIDDAALQTHLFGTSRLGFPPRLVTALRDLQDGQCFYCRDRLLKRVEVDHFLAWSRWPNDAIENLVLADRCNGAKSDHLAAGEHVFKWRRRLDEHWAELADVALKLRWHSDLLRTQALATTTYRHVVAGTPLWRLGRNFVLADGPLSV